MSYIALYRKYRPDSFSTVFGQKIVVKLLQNSIIENKINHSYIFAGSRGTGKTSIAKIFAKSINCLSNENGNACNQCSSCISINQEKTSDIIEIDGASNNGVEEVRKLIESVRYLPIDLKYKVYIIDEAHMLTIQAWNALLKTLEEPPSYVVFIIATTDPHKIPLTILSRSQRYDFLRLSIEDLSSIIKKICDVEKIKIEEKAIEKISQLADGSARDTIGILDQMSFTDKKNITLLGIEKNFGIVNKEKIFDLFSSLSKQNLNKSLSLIEDFYLIGIDVNKLCTDLLNFLIELNIYNNTKQTKNFQFLNEKDVEKLSFILKYSEKMIDVILKFMHKTKVMSTSKLLFNFLVIDLHSIFNDFKDEVIEMPTINSNTKSNFLEKTIKIEEKIQNKKELDNSSISFYNIDLEKPKNEGFSEDDEILNIMIQNNETIRKDLQNKLNEIDQYVITHQREISIYKDAKILVACEEAAIIMFEKEAKVILFKEDIADISSQLFIKTLFGKEIYLYAISKDKAKSLSIQISQNQGNIKPRKLKKTGHVNLEKNDDALEFAKNIFGENLKVK